MRILHDMAIQGATLILLLILLRPLMKKWLGARMRYALWILPALRLLIPFSWQSGLSLWNLAARRISIPETMTNPILNDAANAAIGGTTVSGGEAVQEAVQASASFAEMLPALVLIVWAFGAMAALALMIRANVCFMKNIRGAERLEIPSALPVYVSDSVASPCLVGVLRPRILLTRAAAASAELRDMALLHEQTHYIRRDHILSALRGGLLCLWWWNPLVWIAARLSRADGESACDESILQNMNFSERQRYGLSLLALLSESTKTQTILRAATTMSGGKREMKERILMIANWKKKRRVATVCAALCICLLLPVLCTSALARDEATYLAFAAYSPILRVPGIPEGIDDDSRIVQANLVHTWRPMPLLLPEDAGDPDNYTYVGVRLTFDEPLPTERDAYGNEVFNTGSGLLTPSRVEIVGSVVNGFIVELGEDYVVVEPYGAYRLTDEQSRYAITPDTQMMAIELPFAIGTGCELIVDDTGTVLAMVQGNG